MTRPSGRGPSTAGCPLPPVTLRHPSHTLRGRLPLRSRHRSPVVRRNRPRRPIPTRIPASPGFRSADGRCSGRAPTPLPQKTPRGVTPDEYGETKGVSTSRGTSWPSYPTSPSSRLSDHGSTSTSPPLTSPPLKSLGCLGVRAGGGTPHSPLPPHSSLVTPPPVPQGRH